MQQSNKEIYEYIEIFYRRKWILVFSLFLGIVVGALAAYIIPPSYHSSTLILMERQQVPEAYVTPTDRTPFEQRLNTISQQIMSRTNLEKLINDFKLYKEEDGGDLLSRALGLFVGSRKPSMEDIVEGMKKKIEVKVLGGGGRGGDAFSVSYTGRDPYVTMQVTNSLASLFIEENLKIREQYAEGTAEFIAMELEKAKQGLEEQEKALRGFKERYMGSLPEQLDANLRTLDRLQLELQSIEASLKNQEDRRAFLEEQIRQAPMGSASPLAGPGAGSPEIELARLKAELTSLLSVYKEGYPDVMITRNRIKEIEKTLANARDGNNQKEDEPVRLEPGGRGTGIYADLVGVKSQIEALRKRDAEIRRQIKIFERRVEDTPANEQKLKDISRDYQVSLQNYQSLLEKKLNSRLAENLEKRQKGERFRVIDPANLPEKPYKPNKPKVILLGIMAGTGAGVGLIFLLEFLNPAFRKPEDFAGLLDKPVLAAIPLLSRKSGKISVSPLPDRQTGKESRFKVLKGRKRQG